MRARQVLPPSLPDRGGVRELTAHLRCNIDLYLWIHTEQMARRAAEMENACPSLTIRRDPLPWINGKKTKTKQNTSLGVRFSFRCSPGGENISGYCT